jgi:GNAT superfamily N-acetyltransferase
MEHRGNGLGEPAPGQELGELDARFWAAHRDSMRWFDIVEPDVVEQLQAIERDLFVPAGRRWFAAADDDGIRALAALIVLEGVGYLDHVVTVPGARRRGFASGLTRRAVAAARTSGAERTYLLAEPNGAAARMYADLGFTPIVRLASWISDLAPPP